MPIFGFRKLIKIARNGLKIQNLHGGRKSNWNTSHVGNFFQIFMDFELIKRSYVQQVGLNGGQIG
jgi:hypothetical protein